VPITLKAMARPFFSVLITAYNRADQVARCVDSCRRQTFEDFEIVVVDDASTDATPAILAAIDEPRMRVVRHDHNRGISPARATAATRARGEWFVILDSDWELVEHSLARLAELIEAIPPDVHIIRSRLRADDGSLQPGIVPSGITDYHARLRWCDAVTAAGVASDAGHCMHRSVFEVENFIDDRRGAVETLWELNLARRERSLWVSDVLGLQHTDAANSHTRDVDPQRMIARLRREAPDELWMAETLLGEHASELSRYAPRYERALEESAARQGFLAGDRRAGVSHTLAAQRLGPVINPKLWATLLLGLVGPWALVYAKVGGRRGRAWLSRVR
jgi:Glycosyl transferase family 2